MLMPAIFGENLIDDFFNDFGSFPFYDDDKQSKKLQKQLYGNKSNKLMKTDIKETEDKYILAIELPGFKKENIQASIENGYLTVSAQKTVEKDEAHYLRRERFSGSLQRTFYVGEGIAQEDVQAQFKHGVLKLTVPKSKPEPEIEQNRFISIEG